MLSNFLRRRILRGIAAMLFVSVLCGLGISWAVGDSLVAPANREIGPAPQELICEDVLIPSQSGSTLAGWHMPADHSRGVVVLVHGIHNSRLGMVRRALFLRDAGYSVVMIDLQAHGESPGARITLGQLEQHDVRAAVEFARQVHPGEPVAVIGVSLGGAAAALASPLNVDALVLESVFPRIQEAVCNRIPPAFGPFRRIPAYLLLAQIRPRLGCPLSDLCPMDHVSRAGCPVFILSGEQDQCTTAAEARQLYSQAVEPRELWLVPRAGHDDLCEFASPEYQTRILSFLDRSFFGPSPAR